MVSSAGETRQEQYRLNDEMQFLAIERAISNQEEAEKSGRSGKSHSMRLARTRSRMRSTDEDAFNAPEPTPTFETPMMAEPETKVAKAFLGVKKLPRAIRYILYATPVALVLLVPVFLGLFTPLGEQAAIGGDGGVQLKWFGIWLEIVWLSLWAGRVIMTIIPVIMGFLGKAAGASTSRKWREIGRNLEIPFALFLWMLATMISFQPIVNDRAHRAPRDDPAADPAPDLAWARHIYKVIIAVFVLASMHVVEKVIIQWIASSFHRRTYSQRIETNKQSIAYLVHLYEYSKEQLFREDSIYENDGNGGSGAKTPMAALQKTARQVGNRVGDVAQRIKGDFTGQKIHSRNHPRKVVSELLRSSQTSQVLARRLFRTFAGGKDILEADDLNPAFPTAEDAEAAFMLFDRDLNGDVQCEELEAMCDEVHREKKAIAASLKDLDDVISKLDSTFLVIIVIIAIIVLITIISSSAATALTSAGSTILGLSWLLQATAQEFLQSIIFVFVKHPFDVGDRVTVYGNTGDTGAGDDYYVTAISLLYTEFKKMQGQIVQAPNSVLNTLFILNHRRSNGLADVNTLKMMFGTPESMIDLLKDRMTQFVKANKRDYGGQIITEMTGFEDSYAVSVNFIFFHKSSYQNELLRLTRHNRFACKLQEEMVAVGIEQPRRVYQISGRDFPLYNANIEPPAYTPPPPQNLPREPSEEMFPTLSNTPSSGTNMNNSRESRMRAGSNISITLNDQTVPQGMDFQDVFDSRGTANINPALVRPIGSIRQMERRNHHPEPIMEDAGEGSALNQLNSGSSAATSNRKRMFGGPRRSMTWSKRNTSEDIV
ncbi:Mechanosensitive ion channel-domain-containing protein [Pseudomassariella vexata]|uniref:Mechanosensitive ion channel protein n=1 Tax=Pseudomassariella vexata TaxID=1141098 RepID=A0A1Y2DGU8_9PEZI|nr:Mechanosensitive ion channel-domain-containing protein [Pseudomassariella vexata]ORY58493.1 Mechanosensitive ion channel-domain-containing protein [Pseudomassariella vexata]